MNAISIAVRRYGDRFNAAILQSRSAITPLLVGRSPQEAEICLGRLLPICGAAQQIACRQAVACALEQVDPPSQHNAQLMALHLELLNTILWRWGIDYPQLLGLTSDMERLRELRQLLNQHTNGLLSPNPPPLPDAATLSTWHHAVRTLISPIRDALWRHFERHKSADYGKHGLDFLPAVAWETAEIGQSLLRESHFWQLPHWRQQPACVFPWGMLAADGLGAVLAAETTWLDALLTATSPVGGAIWTHSLGDHTGMAVVTTRRGPLIHVATVENQRVTDYRSVAPTEWQCRPEGPLIRAIHDVPILQAAEFAPFILRAHDPCAPIAMHWETADA